MAGSPTYTSDADLTSSLGANETITGNVSVANTSNVLRGKGTNFTTELRIGDSITFSNDVWFYNN